MQRQSSTSCTSSHFLRLYLPLFGVQRQDTLLGAFCSALQRQELRVNSLHLEGHTINVTLHPSPKFQGRPCESYYLLLETTQRGTSHAGLSASARQCHALCSPVQSIVRCLDDESCGFRSEKAQACLVLVRLKPSAQRPFSEIDL